VSNAEVSARPRDLVTRTEADTHPEQNRTARLHSNWSTR